MTNEQELLDLRYANLVEDLQAGRQEELRRVYDAYRTPFLRWAMSRFQIQKEDALEVFQDVILAFYENVMNGKIDSLSSKLQTYLFGIGRFMLIKRFKANERSTSLELLPADTANALVEADVPQMEISERSVMVQQALQRLGTSCRDLLLAVYYHQYSGEVIAERLGYKNPDVVKSQKARCMKQLRDMMTRDFSREDL
ncbi:MAG: sigma-70 family RNA polymerase sigma factor [Bacteroidia bacterium]|nr:sigma-70 family RNA polymerase sigma factor [Bacteroidia bacterium]